MKITFKSFLIIAGLAQATTAFADNQYTITINTKGLYDYSIEIPQDLPTAQCQPRELARLKPHHVTCIFLAHLTTEPKMFFIIKNKNNSDECTVTGTDSGNGLVLGMRDRCSWVTFIGNSVQLE